jgi:hypothetical protein
LTQVTHLGSILQFKRALILYQLLLKALHLQQEKGFFALSRVTEDFIANHGSPIEHALQLRRFLMDVCVLLARFQLEGAFLRKQLGLRCSLPLQLHFLALQPEQLNLPFLHKQIF